MTLKSIAIALAAVGMAGAQSPDRTGKLEFATASVKPSSPGERPNSNFPLGPGAVYVPNGGLFSAAAYPLVSYISFAWRIQGNQLQYLLPQLPEWVLTDRFDIEARAEGNPAKDEMRLMMRSLLADRFKFAVHNETRQVPALALVRSLAGKLGPRFQSHPGNSPCPTEPSPAVPETVDGYPALCDGLIGLPASAPGLTRVGARNVTTAFIAESLSEEGKLGRPVFDRTGLTGTFDFALEWSPEFHGALPPGLPVGLDFGVDNPSGPNFQEALRDQLGLRLESTEGPVEVLVVDHVEKPGAN